MNVEPLNRWFRPNDLDAHLNWQDPFPYSTRTQFPGGSSKEFGDFIVRSLEKAGFEVGTRGPPTPQKWWKVRGSTDRGGEIVAERNLSYSKSATYLRVVRLLVPLWALTGVGEFVAIVTQQWTTAILVLIVGLIFSFFALGRAATFQSDVVKVSYLGSDPATAAATLKDVETLKHRYTGFDVTVATGQVVSRNWHGKHSGGRSIVRFTADPRLAVLPTELIDLLRRSWVAGSPLPSTTRVPGSARA